LIDHALCEQLFPGKGTPIAQTWRFKQLQYSLMRSHRDFWGLTEDGLVWAFKNAKVDLAAFPDVKPGLEALKKQGIKLAILSNGEPKMLEAAARSAGIRELLDEVIISVEEVNSASCPPIVGTASPRCRPA
jgi:2-haloacid dehalogenase